MSSLIAFREKYFKIYQKHFRSAENSCICKEITELYGFFFFFLGVCVCVREESGWLSGKSSAPEGRGHGIVCAGQ